MREGDAFPGREDAAILVPAGFLGNDLGDVDVPAEERSPDGWARIVSMKGLTGIAGRSGESLTPLRMMDISISGTKKKASDGGGGLSSEI